jgi:hypothetical protein
MALLYGRAGRLTTHNGGFWPGQSGQLSADQFHAWSKKNRHVGQWVDNLSKFVISGIGKTVKVRGPAHTIVIALPANPFYESAPGRHTHRVLLTHHR